ncbi:MAG: lectin like domain-containing protein, partial [Bacteroidota bacterium]|nr:lectin like domain-containing protein [Bacteroidota bacterium]
LDEISTIKQKLMDYGVVGTCMCYSQFLINNNFMHYQPVSNMSDPNHAVSIIGWNDNIVTQAPYPGAWLVKNSWGNGWGLSGYFWISYYDKHTGRHPEMGAISFQDVEPMQYDHIYYHDYHGWRDTKEDCSESFNSFIATGHENINAMSFYTASDSIDYKAIIFGDFDNGQLTDTLTYQEGSFNHIGFHTIDFLNSITIKPGDSIYAYLFLSEGGHAYDRTSDIPVLLGGGSRTTVKSTSLPGQSFYKFNGQWQDMYTLDTTANFCLKVLCKDNLITDIETPASFDIFNFNIYPNPASEHINIVCSLIKDEQITIDLYSIYGQHIARFFDSQISAGKHVIPLQLKQINGKQISKGSYFIRIQSTNGTVSKPIVVL